VSDLVDGFIRLMALPEDPGPVNLGNPRESTVRELAEIVLRLTQSRSQLRIEPLPVDDPTRRCPDISKAKRLLGWEPKVTLEEGLTRTIEYMQEVVVNPSR
jgi:UDP-glucuronate decarboxylase